MHPCARGDSADRMGLTVAPGEVVVAGIVGVAVGAVGRKIVSVGLADSTPLTAEAPRIEMRTPVVVEEPR